MRRESFFSLVLIVGRSKLLLLQVEFSATCNLSHQCVRFRTSGSCSGEKMACSEWHTHYGVPEMWQCFIYQWHSSHAKNQHNNNISSSFLITTLFSPTLISFSSKLKVELLNFVLGLMETLTQHSMHFVFINFLCCTFGRLHAHNFCYHSFSLLAFWHFLVQDVRAQNQNYNYKKQNER